jgi:hypothetical protein
MACRSSVIQAVKECAVRPGSDPATVRRDPLKRRKKRWKRSLWIQICIAAALLVRAVLEPDPRESFWWDRCYDIKNIFAQKFGKKLPFLTQNKVKLFKILIETLVFEKNANFFAENCQKTQKIVIIKSTPEAFGKKLALESDIWALLTGPSTSVRGVTSAFFGWA